MPIGREDGFFQSHDSGLGSRLGIESSRLIECVAQIGQNRIKGVFGAPSFGFNGVDLDFLTDVPWVEDLWFWDINLKNIDGLYALRDLRYFGVHPKRPPIDFSCFPRLWSAVVEPRTYDRGIGELNELERLHLWHFRPRDGSYSSFDFPGSLKELHINWASPASLESLPALPQLRRLEVHRCRNLRFLGDLGAKFPNLTHLVITACGEVANGEGERVVRELPRLAHAYVQNTKLV